MSASKPVYIHKVSRKIDYSDRVTMNGARLVTVPQYDGEWPPFAEILTSVSPQREPTLKNAWNAQLGRIGLYYPLTFEPPPDHKWCPQCGDWRHKSQFAPDRTKSGGLNTYCKPCRAAEKKRREWLQHDSEVMAQEWRRRHILRLIPLQTEDEQAA